MLGEDDISTWVAFCITLHQDKAAEYARSQMHKMKQMGETEGADFWSHVALAIDQASYPTKEELH